MEQDNPQPAAPPHATLSGRWLVAMTLSLFLLIPTITYFAYQATQGTPQTVSLDYDQRDQWFMQEVKSRPLRYSKFVEGETGKKYKKTDLVLNPDVEAVLQQCARLAQANDFFTNEEARDQLAGFAEDEANGFYPPYLLASWHLSVGNKAEHDRWMRIAFDRAGGAIAQRLIDDTGEPAAGVPLAPVAIGYDRVTDGEIDTTLVLIYPAPTSDANGFVYLPTFRSVYRLTDPALPPGVDPGMHPIQLTLLPQPALGRDQPNWFSAPDGAVGQLPDAVVTESP